jgi:predicted NBD/HSP70 family sugar kinase
VLETILRCGSVSRSQIAKLTGLSKPTVSSAVSDLERPGLVRLCGSLTGAVGRPAALYEVDRRAGYVFGVDLGGTKIRAGVADLYGVVQEEVLEPTAKHRGTGVVRILTRLLQTVLERSSIDSSLIRAAALGVAGIYEPDTDSLSAAYNLPPVESGVVAALQAALDLPLLINNDVNFAAVGERWRGLAQGCTDFVTISVGTGIGMGVVINGEVYSGSTGAAGEIGFLPLGVDDPFESTYRAGGPFESVASGSGGLTRLRHLVDEDPADTSLGPRSSLLDALKAAAHGDRLGLQLVDDEARLIALGVGAVCSVLDPELVVLGGGVGANPILLSPVRRYVKALLPRQPRIEVSGLGDRASFYGAIAAGLAIARGKLLNEVVENAHRMNGGDQRA